jgi:hypothetical protein
MKKDLSELPTSPYSLRPGQLYSAALVLDPNFLPRVPAFLRVVFFLVAFFLAGVLSASMAASALL